MLLSLIESFKYIVHTFKLLRFVSSSILFLSVHAYTYLHTYLHSMIVCMYVRNASVAGGHSPEVFMMYVPTLLDCVKLVCLGFYDWL